MLYIVIIARFRTTIGIQFLKNILAIYGGKPMVDFFKEAQNRREQIVNTLSEWLKTILFMMNPQSATRHLLEKSHCSIKKDEYVDIDDLILATAIYAEAIYNLAK